MPPILRFGLDLIAAVQRCQSPFLVGIFRGFSFLGEEMAFLVLLPFFLWCVDYTLGLRVGFLFLISNAVNTGLKDLFRQPRPFDHEPSVKLSSAEGYGLPSGHAQTAVVVWGMAAAWARKTWCRVAAILLMALIGFSRIYLGVHFPTDVLAGWAIGAALLAVFITLEPRASNRLARMGLGWQAVLSLLIPIELLLLYPTKDTVTIFGTLAGVALGASFARAFLDFDARGAWPRRAARYILGALVMLALYFGLKAVLPGESSRFYLAFRFIRYGLVGLWAALGAPWFFIRLRLAGRESRQGD